MLNAILMIIVFLWLILITVILLFQVRAIRTLKVNLQQFIDGVGTLIEKTTKKTKRVV